MIKPSFIDGLRESDLPAARERAAHVRLRTVALPIEHGGWGFLLEPLALGLLVAPSPAGICLALAAAGAFLTRHPLKIVLADWRRGRSFPRTSAARRFALLYASVAVAGLLGAWASAADLKFLLPLLAATPFAAVHLWCDVKGRGRSLAAETAGALALVSSSACVALAGGWNVAAAFALWALLAARAVPSIIYVQARVAELHGEPQSEAPALAAHALALVAVVLLALYGDAPALAVTAMCVLLVRACCGLWGEGRATTAKRIGVLEVGYGALTVALIAAGYLLGW